MSQKALMPFSCKSELKMFNYKLILHILGANLPGRILGHEQVEHFYDLCSYVPWTCALGCMASSAFCSYPPVSAPPTSWPLSGHSSKENVFLRAVARLGPNFDIFSIMCGFIFEYTDPSKTRGIQSLMWTKR